MHRSSLPSRVDDSGQSKHESNGNSSDRFHQCVSCLIWKVRVDRYYLAGFAFANRR